MERECVRSDGGERRKDNKECDGRRVTREVREKQR